MPAYSAVVKLGNLAVTVTADTIHELLQERRYLWELDQAREGKPAVPFFRDDREGNAYYGFRRDDGAEVMLGRHRQPSGPTRLLFAYGTESKGYKGWERYDPGSGERTRVEESSGAEPTLPGARGAARQGEPAREPDGEGETRGDLTPDDYVTAVVEAAERLRDGVRGTIDVQGAGDVKDVRAWVLEHRERMRDPAVYRVVMRCVSGLLTNPRNRRKASAEAGKPTAAAPREETPAGSAEPSAAELHAAHLEYIKAVGPRAGDAAQIIVGTRSRNLKRYVREQWGLIKSDPGAARGAVEAIERATRTPFAALIEPVEEPDQHQQATGKGGRR